MLTKTAFELQDLQSEYDQTPVDDAERLFPLDQTRQNTEPSADEYQVAGIFEGVSSGLARSASRALSGRSTLSAARRKLNEKIRRQQDLKAALADPAADPAARYSVEPATGAFEVIDNADGSVLARYTTEAEAKRHLVNTQPEALDLGAQPAAQQPPPARAQPGAAPAVPETATTQPPPAAAQPGAAPAQPAAQPEVDSNGLPLPASLESEMVRDGGYDEWITFDDEDMAAWMSGIRAKTVPQDGIIASAGLRVEGTQPGMETKIPDEGHIYSIIATAAEQIEAKLATLGKDKQKAITLAETRVTADLLGENPEKLMRRMFGGNIDVSRPGALAAHMVASRDLLVSEIRILDELADFASGARPHNHSTEQVQAQWLQQAELVANIQKVYKGAQTDIARAMSAMRVPARSDAALLQRDYADLVEKAGGRDKISGLIDGYRKEKDLGKRANQVRQVSKFGRILDGVHEMWINSMLGSYRTQMKNTVGTWTIITADLIEGNLAAAMQLPKLVTGGQRSITFSEVQAKTFGEMMALREATSAAGRAFWLREAPPVGGEMTIISGQNSLRPDAISAENWNVTNKAGARAINIFGNLVTAGRAPTRMLQAGDAFNKVVAYRGKLWEEAYRAGRLEGKKGEDLEDFIVDFLLEPPDDIADKALEFAKYVTLQGEYDHGSKLRKMQSVAGSRLGRIIIPFYKTPLESVFYVGEHSPFAPLMKKRFRDKVREGGAAKTTALARMATGSALMVWVASEYDSQNFTGGISSDARVRAAYERQGIKPYHIRIWDTWWNYNNLEPYSTLIGLIGDGMEIIAHKDTDDRTSAEVWIGLAGVIGYNMQNKTFMASLNTALEAMGDPGRYGDKFISGLQRSMYPGSAALKDFRLMADNLKRLRIEMNDVYRAQLPGLSNELEARLDLWGRPTEYSYFSSPYKPNTVDQELVRLRLGLAPHPKSLSAEIGLEAKEITWFHERAGKLAFKQLEMLMDEKTPQGKKYAVLKRMSEAGSLDASEKCALEIRKVLNLARDIARRELVLESPHAEVLQEIITNVNLERKAKGLETLQLFEAMK